MDMSQTRNDSIFFISPDIDRIQIRTKLEQEYISESRQGCTGSFFSSAMVFERFLSTEGRQFLEGQIFAYGSDLTKVCRTVSSQFCPDEITVPRPEKQIPVIGDFAFEFDQFAQEISSLRFRSSVYQLRVYRPNYNGHPEHVDYAPGFSLSQGVQRNSFTTSLSFSLPISWNEGSAPVFRMHTNRAVVEQNLPGSLAVFGPRILHAHPAAPELSENYAWLIIQTFYEGHCAEENI